MIAQNNRLAFIVLGALSLLLIPLLAMQLGNEVNWSPFDFLIMGTLLVGTGLAVEFALRKVKDTKARVFWILAILLGLFLVWAELAVGIFGTPFAGN